MKHSQYSSLRGVTIIDTLITLACLKLIFITAIVCTSDTPQLTTKDAVQLTEIHQAMLVYAAENNQYLPLPGLINRLPARVGEVEQEKEGSGPEDISRNTTAALFSAIIAQNYIPPEILISPIERNPCVKNCKNYNYGSYFPLEDVYWDKDFKADLTLESHTSYAHLVLFGERKEKQWQTTMDSSFPQMSNRGPKKGKLNPQSYTCGPHGHWAGHVAYADNHIVLRTSTRPEEPAHPDQKEKDRDNLFAYDDGVDGGDAILTFTQKIDKKHGPTIQFD